MKSERIAILGGGPAAMFVYFQLVEKAETELEVKIFEKKSKLGTGMPYSYEGAGREHVTNVADKEIPHLAYSIKEWLANGGGRKAREFGITENNFNDLKVLPRLLFGEYMHDQFEDLIEKGRKKNIKTEVILNCTVKDISPELEGVKVLFDDGDQMFDRVFICTGHNWPNKNEKKSNNYFDSPYPPSKLEIKMDGEIAIRGASLTAFDALRTLSRKNGEYKRNKEGRLEFFLNKESENFRLIMHSLNGLLPAIRIHFDDPCISKESTISEELINEHRACNNGFVSLDFLFETHFKQHFLEKDPVFFEKIKDMCVEEFVDMIMEKRRSSDPFELFRKEFDQAAVTIATETSIPWKEMISILSYALNYPAKHFSAEDMLRHKKVLQPLISLVIAFVPQSSAEELLALYDAGVLTLISVDRDSYVETCEDGGANYHYKMDDGQEMNVHYDVFVDAIGQPAFNIKDFPFKGLTESGTISQALLEFRSAQEAQNCQGLDPDKVLSRGGKYYLKVSGIAINDQFQVVNENGEADERIYILAVPYIGGYNPDYSGLDFCDTAAEKAVEGWRERG